MRVACLPTVVFYIFSHPLVQHSVIGHDKYHLSVPTKAEIENDQHLKRRRGAEFTTRANPSKHPIVGHFWTPRRRRYLEKEVVIFFNIRGKFCSTYPSGQVYSANNPNTPLGTYWEVWNQDYFHHLKQEMSRKAATPLNQALHPNNRLSRRD